LVDRDDSWHTRVTSWWEGATGDVLVPVVVLPEVTYLLTRRIGPLAELAFTRAVAAGEFAIEPLLAEDVARAAELMAIYADAPLRFVDASLTAIAERVGVVSLLTTDRRHFSLVRPQHVSAFHLLP
jgi:predicted nucleic acid-binding protein